MKEGKGIALVLGPSHDDEPSGELGLALKSLAKALKSEDWQRAEDAFREAVYACDDQDEEQKEEDDSSDDSDDGELSL